MGRVQGGARAAFATPSWGPARMTYFFILKKTTFIIKSKNLFFKFLNLTQ